MRTRLHCVRPLFLCSRTWAGFRIPPGYHWYVKSRLTAYLRKHLLGTVYVHATLVNVSGAGVMIRGASGSGKSRCALELIRRGHQLVADDLVCVRRRGRGRLRGSSHQGIKGLIEVRGRGIVNVCEQFEASVVSGSSPVDLVFDLTGMPGRQGIGAEPCSRFRLLGRDLPVFRWSGSSGDDPADSVERVAADRRVWAGAVL